MIDTALGLIRDKLDAYVRSKLGLTAEVVELTRLTNAEGRVALDDLRIGMSLVNIEEERVLRDQQPEIRREGAELSYSNPEVRVNLYVLFASNHQIYSEGLLHLAAVMSFFQSQSVFDLENSPELDPSIRRMAVDLYSLPFEQMNYLWGTLATGYLPSVLYRVRVISIRDERILTKGRLVEALDVEPTTME